MARSSPAVGMRARRPTEHATDREIVVVAAVLVAGSEKAAAHRLGLSHSTVKHHLANARSKVGAATTAQLVWILAPRLPPAEERCRRDKEGAPSVTRDRPTGRCEEDPVDGPELGSAHRPLQHPELVGRRGAHAASGSACSPRRRAFELAHRPQDLREHARLIEPQALNLVHDQAPVAGTVLQMRPIRTRHTSGPVSR